MVFFGFTQCPDVCPTTLAELKAVKEKLGPDARARAGAVRHGRPRARHARAAGAVRAGVPPDLRRAPRRRGGDRAHREGVQGGLQESARLEPDQLHGRSLCGALHLRPPGGCGSSRSTGKGRTRSRTTSSCCSSRRAEPRKAERPAEPGVRRCESLVVRRPRQCASAPISPRIFCIAFASIWRMRSADTPNSAASSCSVAVSVSGSQRASMMRRLRGSSDASAAASPAARRRSVSSASSSRRARPAGPRGRRSARRCPRRRRPRARARRPARRAAFPSPTTSSGFTFSCWRCHGSGPA